MATFHYDNLAKNLPDCYKKDTDSNNFKILEIERQANVSSRSILESIDEILDIENAAGATLDLYGNRVGQPRGSASDAQYRIMIKSKIARSNCDGSYKGIIDALAFTFGCSKDEILLMETGTPLTVTVYRVPMSAIISAGFSIKEAEQIIQKTMPIGVTIESVMFEGTFEFGAEEYESGVDTDPETGEKIYTGFVNESGDGGYLGYASSTEQQGDLPI